MSKTNAWLNQYSTVCCKCPRPMLDWNNTLQPVMENWEKRSKAGFQNRWVWNIPLCSLIDEQPKTEPIKETHSRKHYEKWDRMAKEMQICPLKGKKHKAHCKRCTRVVLVKHILQLVMKNWEKTFNPINQTSRLSNIIIWQDIVLDFMPGLVK